jgi:hypothetical protein
MICDYYFNFQNIDKNWKLLNDSSLGFPNYIPTTIKNYKVRYAN